MRSEMKKKEEMGKPVKTIQEEFGEAPMTLEDRRTVALERIADSAKKEEKEEEEVLEELVKTIQEEFGEATMTLEERRTVALERIADSANALVNLILLCLHKDLRYILFTKVMWTAFSIVAAIALVTAANKTT